MKSIAIRYSVGSSPEDPDKLECFGFVRYWFSVFLAPKGPKKAPIYFCPVGTLLAFSLKFVSMVPCCTRLCTKDA